MIKAALEHDANEAVGLDGALQELVTQKLGPFLLGADRRLPPPLRRVLLLHRGALPEASEAPASTAATEGLLGFLVIALFLLALDLADLLVAALAGAVALLVDRPAGHHLRVALLVIQVAVHG